RIDTDAPARQQRRPGHVDTDIVALDAIPGSTVAAHTDGDDEVARRGRRTADEVVGRVVHGHARTGQRVGAGDVGAEKIPLKAIAAHIIQLDADLKAIDNQAADDTAASGNPQPSGAVSCLGALELD